MASVLSSVLEEVIKSFAGNAFKKQTILNALKNRGVKDIELEQSGMKKFIEEYKGEKIPVSELEAVTKARPDNLKTQGIKRGDQYGNVDKPYAGIREKNIINNFQAAVDTFDIPRAHQAEALTLINKAANLVDNPDTSKHQIIAQLQEMSNNQDLVTEQSLDKAAKLYLQDKGKYNIDIMTKNMPHGVRNHFNNPDYYSHVRYTDIPNDARYVHEIQTDVHQGNRQVLDELGMTKHEGVLADKTQEIAEQFGVDPEDDVTLDSIRDLLEHRPEHLESSTGQKLIKDLLGEYQINRDASFRGEGEKLFARPEKFKQLSDMLIKNAQELEKIKTTNSFEGQEPNWLNSTINKTLVDAANEGQKIVKVRIAPDKNLMRAEGVQKWYEDTVSPTLQKTAKKIGAEAKMTDDGYMEVKLPEKDFSLPLYSATGIGVLSATTATKAQAAELPGKIKEARDAGYSDEEIQAFTKDKYDPNVLQRSFNPTQGAQ